MHNPITFDELSVATEPGGLHVPSIWFGGGRIAAHVTHYGGIDEINYYGAQPIDRRLFYKVNNHSPYERLFCPYLLIGDKAWQLELNQTRIFPGGYTSRMAVPEEGVEIAHSLILLDDAILNRVEVLRNDGARPLRLRLSLHEHLRKTLPHRTWGEWREDIVPGAQVITVADPEGTLEKYYPSILTPGEPNNPAASGNSVTTWIGVVGSTSVGTRIFFTKRHHFTTEEIKGNTGAICVLFGKDEAEFKVRAALLQSDGPRLGAEVVAGWEEKLRAAPALALDRPVVESFFRQAGLINDSLKPADLPGGMRAAAGHYWVWGWDTIVYCDSDLVSGRAAFVRDALDLYRRTAHPQLGIGHKFSERMELLVPQALSAQGLYLNMLYQHAAHTGERAVLEDFYPFALSIFQRTISQGRCEGLFTGSALWPDQPRFAGHANAEGEVSDRDISIFNNGIFYQSARAMEHLAGMMGDAETARTAREIWMALEASFRKFFWDPERNYWFDSLETGSLTPRRSYPAHAVIWINPFARDLVGGREEACADFLAANHACAGGIRPYPAWDSAFNGDGNQLAQWYPTGPDVYFLKTMGATGRQAMLERWLGWVEEFWGSYTVPEGLTLEAENDGPHRPDCPGGKQPFTVKPWQMGIITAILGIDLDHGGMTAGPGLDEPVTLVRLPFQGRQFSISTKGEGLHVAKITVNGKEVAGSYKIPVDHCADAQQDIQITRTDKPPTGPVILSADGAALSEVTVNGGTLKARIECPASVRVWFYSPARPRVTWENQPVDAAYDEQTGRASILLVPENTLLEGELSVS